MQVGNLLNRQVEDPLQNSLDTVVDRAEKCETFRREIFAPLIRTFVSRKIKAMKESKAARFVRSVKYLTNLEVPSVFSTS